MSLRRYAAKRDDAEPEVVEAFLDGGATVVKHAGKCESDLFVAYKGRWHSVEVKTGGRVLKRDQHQRDWAKLQAAPVHEARNEAQAKKLMRMWDLETVARPDLEDDSDAFRNRVNPSKRDGEPA